MEKWIKTIISKTEEWTKIITPKAEKKLLSMKINPLQSSVAFLCPLKSREYRKATPGYNGLSFESTFKDAVSVAACCQKRMVG